MAPVAVPAAVPPPAPGPGAFVGRSTELRRLQAAWADTRAGRRRTMLVAGEAGIGKTRLATELALQAERDGSVVLAVAATSTSASPTCAAGGGRSAPGQLPLRAAPGPARPEGGRAGPVLAGAGLAPARPPGPVRPIGPAADPYLLLEALTGLLEAIAVTSPLLLLVDDLHGADEGSLLLLRSLAGARRPARLLTVLTYRDDERGPRATLTAALGDLVRAPGAELLTLDGLGADEVAAMAEAAATRPLGQGGKALAHVLRGAPAATRSWSASCCDTWPRPAASTAATSPRPPSGRPPTSSPRACAGSWASGWPASGGRSSTCSGSWPWSASRPS